MGEKKETVTISFEREHSLVQSGYAVVCGVDEAGRGPLAGPVYAAAAILPADFDPTGLNDSKKLNEATRERLYEHIIATATDYCIATASVAEIEEHNILNATMMAMNRAVSGLKQPPDYLLIDGNRLPPGLPTPAAAIVGGDARCFCIAAASVLAKVARDRYMRTMDTHYPMYGFRQHKGYGTKAHTDAILTYGPCPEHRLSFLKKLLSHE